jgi:hypothetical protein
MANDGKGWQPKNMAWARLDDGFGDHQKVLDLIDTLPELEGAAAIGLWTLALAYAHGTMRLAKTPGFIPRSFARSRARVPAQIGDRLVAVGLWETADGGWLIHDFDDYLPSDELRAKRAEAGRRGARARWERESAGQDAAGPHMNGETPGGDSNLPSVAIMANGKSCPEPEPEPIKKTSSSTASRKRSAKTELPEHPLFAEFWKAYPRREGKGTARKAFSQAVDNGATPEVIASAAARFARHCIRVKTERGYMPHPTTWLNQERWEDEYDADPGTEGAPPKPLPPHCGHCDPANRWIELPDGRYDRCPDCHPDNARSHA